MEIHKCPKVGKWRLGTNLGTGSHCKELLASPSPSARPGLAGCGMAPSAGHMVSGA